MLAQQVGARRLASNLVVQFSKAADASNPAVMSDADEDATAVVRDAEQATRGVQRDTHGWSTR